MAWCLERGGVPFRETACLIDGMIKSGHDSLYLQCRGNWSEIISHMAPEMIPAIRRSPRHGPCPWHGGADGFRCFDDFEVTGGAVCNTCGAYSNGLRLLAHHKGWTMKKTRREVFRSLRAVNNFSVTNYQEVRDYMKKNFVDIEKICAIEKVLSECVHLKDPAAVIVKQYLEGRGIPFRAYYRNLLFHPALSYFEGGVLVGNFPALIAKVEDDDGLVTLHRTYLTPEGKKAPVPSPKKLMPVPYKGRLSGASIRLFPPPYAELAVAEGIESAIAARYITDTQVWATVSAHGMETLVVPGDVKNVFIFGDNDRSGAGQSAAKKLAKRLRAEGHSVDVFIPKQPIPDGSKGVDWLDVYTGRV